MKAFGRTFQCTGSSVAEAEDLALRSAESFGLAKTRRVATPAGVYIELAQQCHWPAVILTIPVQRLSIAIRRLRASDTLELHLDQTRFAWCRCLICGLACAGGILWLYGIATLFAEPILPEQILFPCAAAVPIFFATRLVLSGGRSGFLGLIEELRREFRVQGCALDEVSAPHRDRGDRGAAHYLLFILSLAAATFLLIEYPDFDIDDAGDLCVALTIFVVVLSGLAAATGILVAMRRRGVEARFATLAPALSFGMGAILLTVSLGAFFFFGSIDTEGWFAAFYSRQLLARAAGEIIVGPSGPVPAAVIEEKLGQVRSMMVFLLTLPCLAWLMAAAFIWKSLRGIDLITQICRRIGADITTEGARLAASGERFLKWFRFSFATMWVCCGVFVVAGYGAIITVIVSCVRFLSSLPNEEPVGVIIGTASAVSLALGYEQVSAGVLTASWIAWIGICAVALAVPGVSLGQRFVQRLRAFRQLSETPDAHTGLLLAQVGVAVKILARRAGCAIPNVTIIEAGRPYAMAFEFGWIRPQRFIAVSPEAIRTLNPVDLEALLAHEMAHLVCGHCRRHNLLQWLGRLTLMGGTFVGGLEDSFGHERVADRLALTRFGVSREALQSCLMVTHAASSVCALVPLERHTGQGLPFAATADLPSESNAQRNLLREFRGQITEWLAYYFADTTLAYWHPSLQERMRNLSEELAIDTQEARLVEDDDARMEVRRT